MIPNPITLDQWSPLHTIQIYNYQVIKLFKRCCFQSSMLLPHPESATENSRSPFAGWDRHVCLWLFLRMCAYAIASYCIILHHIASYCIILHHIEDTHPSPWFYGRSFHKFKTQVRWWAQHKSAALLAASRVARLVRIEREDVDHLWGMSGSPVLPSGYVKIAIENGHL